LIFFLTFLDNYFKLFNYQYLPEKLFLKIFS
jgi:hypothetical protein